MSILINLLVLLLVLLVIWKILEIAFSSFGAPLGGNVKAIIGLIFLLIFLVQALGLIGYGAPLFTVYR